MRRKGAAEEKSWASERGPSFGRPFFCPPSDAEQNDANTWWFSNQSSDLTRDHDTQVRFWLLGQGLAGLNDLISGINNRTTDYPDFHRSN